ncbi:hypothetical protein NDU88_000407 [Pleurodeles waltl]|uniref:Uncharacterized protein n=1 Tax=Pleurodeles waltl TaxID=8319 RepID=A0AAV7VWE8_PLEWA|nr:hypothetical protein NDU88_000407 [Pleurodeles waltl]
MSVTFHIILREYENKLIARARYYERLERLRMKLKKEALENKAVEERLVGPRTPKYRTSEKGDVCRMAREHTSRQRDTALQSSPGFVIESELEHVDRHRRTGRHAIVKETPKLKPVPADWHFPGQETYVISLYYDINTYINTYKRSVCLLFFLVVQ